MNLSETIRVSRFKKNVTQEELGNMAGIGVSRHTIMSIEKERTNPSWRIVQKISKILEFSLDDIEI